MGLWFRPLIRHELSKRLTAKNKRHDGNKIRFVMLNLWDQKCCSHLLVWCRAPQQSVVAACSLVWARRKFLLKAAATTSSVCIYDLILSQLNRLHQGSVLVDRPLSAIKKRYIYWLIFSAWIRFYCCGSYFGQTTLESHKRPVLLHCTYSSM